MQPLYLNIFLKVFESYLDPYDFAVQNFEQENVIVEMHFTVLRLLFHCFDSFVRETVHYFYSLKIFLKRLTKRVLRSTSQNETSKESSNAFHSSENCPLNQNNFVQSAMWQLPTRFLIWSSHKIAIFFLSLSTKKRIQ